MKLITLILIIINILTLSSRAEMAYIDMGLILKKSELGKSLNEKITLLENNHITKFKQIESKLISKEKSLLAQKNILDQNEFEKKLDLLTAEIKKYRSDKKLSENKLNKIKIDDTKEILKILNPIITNYVDKNSISIVIPKKNIIVGKKKLDITYEIINLLNLEATNIKFWYEKLFF